MYYGWHKCNWAIWECERQFTQSVSKIDLFQYASQQMETWDEPRGFLEMFHLWRQVSLGEKWRTFAKTEGLPQCTESDALWKYTWKVSGKNSNEENVPSGWRDTFFLHCQDFFVTELFLRLFLWTWPKCCEIHVLRRMENYWEQMLPFLTLWSLSS